MSRVAPFLVLKVVVATSLTVGATAARAAAQEPGRQDAAGAKRPEDRKSLVLRALGEKLETSLAPYVGGGLASELEKRLDSLPLSASAAQICGLHLQLGNALLGGGDCDDAIAQYQAALLVGERAKDASMVQASHLRLALAWMRVGERRNCIAHHNQDSCLLPLRGRAQHQDREGSTKAIEHLLEVLKLDPNHLQSIWLLNIAHMTLGSWPDGVPRQWRILPSAFASEHELPRMFDVAPRVGLNVTGRAGASMLDDFDGDGRLDVVTSSMDPLAPLRMFRQQADGTFRDVAAEVGLAGQLGGLQGIHFDANNDGRLDLLMQRGAWLTSFGEIPNSLLIQQPDGTFVDRTQEAGIEIAAPSQVAAVADVDNDGDLDLFLGYESDASRAPIRYPSRLFLNRGDGTFEDVTAKAGVANERYCKGAAFGDCDGDRLPDLYVSNLRGPNRLYHNNGDGTFTDVALELGVHDPHDGFGCWYFDYDNDGDLDLYVACYSETDRAAEMAGFYKNRSTGRDTQRLYENDGRGAFRDVTIERGLARTVFPMGCNFGDADNDGWLDFYLGTGDPEFSSLFPNVFYRNDRGRRFQDVTLATMTGHLQKGHGVSFGDVDDDGDQDLFEEMGGAYKDDTAASVLYENPGHGNHWLTVRLVGRRSNRFGVGARIRVRIEEPGAEPAGTRDVYAFVGANSSFGGNSLQEEIGLGRATRIVELAVSWPATGATQTFGDVPLDRTVVVDEGQRELALVPPRVREPASTH